MNGISEARITQLRKAGWVIKKPPSQRMPLAQRKKIGAGVKRAWARGSNPSPTRILRRSGRPSRA